MKAELTVFLDGLTPDELQKIIQGIRDVEQTAPERIMLGLLVKSPDMSRTDTVVFLNKINPPMGNIAYIALNRSLDRWADHKPENPPEGLYGATPEI